VLRAVAYTPELDTFWPSARISAISVIAVRSVLQQPMTVEDARSEYRALRSPGMRMLEKDSARLLAATGATRLSNTLANEIL